MSNVIDTIFAEVCLDERVNDGIFKLDEAEHMNALRDYFIKWGITKEEAISITNRMVEGRFPERQAYNKDGILVTFPTPKHKANAIKRGTHFEKNPNPQAESPKSKDELQPHERGQLKEPPVDDKSDEEELPKSDEEEEIDDKPKSNLFDDEPNVNQGGKQLSVEPLRGDEKPEPAKSSSPPLQPTPPRTPERIAAEKEVVKQILATDDTALNPIQPQGLSEACIKELNQLYKTADEMGLREAVKFLTTYVKP